MHCQQAHTHSFQGFTHGRKLQQGPPELPAVPEAIEPFAAMTPSMSAEAPLTAPGQYTTVLHLLQDIQRLSAFTALFSLSQLVCEINKIFLCRWVAMNFGKVCLLLVYSQVDCSSQAPSSRHSLSHCHYRLCLSRSARPWP